MDTFALFLESFSALQAGGAAAVAFLLTIALKASLLLAVAAVVAWVLRRGSAALRHLVWSVALASLLVLPVLSVVLPDWTVRLDQIKVSVQVPESVPGPVAVANERPAAPAADAGARGTSPAPEYRAVAAVPGQAASPGAWLLGAWLLGTLALLARLVAGRWAAWRVARRGEPLGGIQWTAQLEGASARLGLRRRVKLLRTADPGAPMTCGTLFPAVLLPAAADDWTLDRRRVVLLHELAHVRRFDCLTQMMAQLACALFWFHPGVWWAARELRKERELACDDAVLHAGTRPTDYALHLVDVARGFRGDGLAAAGGLAMARPSQLEGRVQAILDPVRNRRGASAEAGLALALFAASVAIPLAAMEPRPASVAPGDGDAVTLVADAGADATLASDAGYAPPVAAVYDPDLAALVAALHDEDPEVRRQAVWIIGKLADDAALPALEDVLDSDSDADVRRMAAWAMAEIGSEDAAEALLAATRHDSSHDVRQEARSALAAVLARRENAAASRYAEADRRAEASRRRSEISRRRAEAARERAGIAAARAARAAETCRGNRCGYPAPAYPRTAPVAPIAPAAPDCNRKRCPVAPVAPAAPAPFPGRAPSPPAAPLPPAEREVTRIVIDDTEMDGEVLIASLRAGWSAAGIALETAQAETIGRDLQRAAVAAMSATAEALSRAAAEIGAETEEVARSTGELNQTVVEVQGRVREVQRASERVRSKQVRESLHPQVVVTTTTRMHR